jgi:hypothetical protein
MHHKIITLLVRNYPLRANCKPSYFLAAHFLYTDADVQYFIQSYNFCITLCSYLQVKN